MFSNTLFELGNEGKVWSKRFWQFIAVALGLMVAGLALFLIVVGILDDKPVVVLCGLVMDVALTAYCVFELQRWKTLNV